MPITEGSEEVSRQRQYYSGAIGSFDIPSLIDDIVAFAQDAKLPQLYSDYEDDYWYEMLEKDGLGAKVGAIADAWSEEETNVKRAAGHVRRPITRTGRSIVKKFGFCQFKPTPDQSTWYLHIGPGTDREQQIMVFVALEDLGPQNGFPFEMARGQYVCMDGQADILTPPTGGGRAICFALRL